MFPNNYKKLKHVKENIFYTSLLSLSPVILFINLIDMFDIDDFKHHV